MYFYYDSTFVMETEPFVGESTYVPLQTFLPPSMQWTPAGILKNIRHTYASAFLIHPFQIFK